MAEEGSSWVGVPFKLVSQGAAGSQHSSKPQCFEFQEARAMSVDWLQLCNYPGLHSLQAGN